MIKKVIKIDGGIGRVIALSGVVKQGDIVVTSFPEIFFGRIDIKVYPLSHPYLFEDIVYNNDWVEVEPYNDSDYYRNKKHISAVFNKLIYSELKGIRPVIEFQKEELVSAKKQIKDWKKDWKKDIIMFQPFGSNITQDTSKRAMSIETAQSIVDECNRLGYEVIYVKGGEHPELKNVKTFNFQLRQILALATAIDKFICIDSFLQHLVGALNKKGLVFWTGTNKDNLGYSNNINITVGEPTLFVNRIPMNNPNIINLNYDWSNVLKHVKKYLK